MKNLGTVVLLYTVKLPTPRQSASSIGATQQLASMQHTWAWCCILSILHQLTIGFNLRAVRLVRRAAQGKDRSVRLGLPLANLPLENGVRRRRLVDHVRHPGVPAKRQPLRRSISRIQIYQPGSICDLPNVSAISSLLRSLRPYGSYSFSL